MVSADDRHDVRLVSCLRNVFRYRKSYHADNLRRCDILVHEESKAICQ